MMAATSAGWLDIVARLAFMARAEQTCCAFLRFAITVDERGLAVEVRSQPDGLDVIRALFM